MSRKREHRGPTPTLDAVQTVESISPANAALTDAHNIYTADQELSDGKNLIVGTGTGTKIGTAANQKLAWHGATPVVQRAGAAQAAVTPSTDFTGADTVDKAALLAAVQALQTLVNELRAAAVEKGMIKGSA